MIDLNWSLLIQLINFLITLVVLNFLIIRPIREVIRGRQLKMSGLLTEAEKFADAADTKVKNYEKALMEAREKATVEREAMRDAGLEEEKKLLASAGDKARQTLEAARKDVDEQMKAAMANLKGQVDDFAQKAADKVLG